ncbi:MAG: DUF3592 domain-containing protein [Opitutales bacterium]|nr:DUF3592 domain-containing protein [Opitutales bacterium]
MAKTVKQAKSLSRKQKIFFGRIFPWFFFLPGVVILFFGLRALQESRESLNWPSVEGQVLSSKIVESRSSSSSGGSSTSYRADVTYRYTVDGSSYTGDRIQASSVSSSNHSRARAMTRKYPEGKTVEVFYNPDRPYRSLLEPGKSLGALLTSGFGGLFATFGLVMVLFLPRLLKHREKLETEHENFCNTPSPVGVSREPLSVNSCYSWIPLKFLPQADGSVSLQPGSVTLIPGLIFIVASPVMFLIANHYEWDTGWRLVATLFPLFGGVPMVLGSILMKLLMTKHWLRSREGLWEIKSYGNPPEEISFSKIIAMQVIPGNQLGDSRNGGNMLPYQLNLVLTEEKRINLVQSSDRKGCLRLARKITEFLQVPLVGLEIEQPKQK